MIHATEQEKHRNRMRDISRKAVKSGELIKQPCMVCGSLKSEIHHSDYDKPFMIEWLCRSDHFKKHRQQAQPIKKGQILIIRDIDPALHKELKMKALVEDITMQDLIKKILKAAVNQKKGGK